LDALAIVEVPTAKVDQENVILAGSTCLQHLKQGWILRQ
jgi:hypothetical protein